MNTDVPKARLKSCTLLAMGPVVLAFAIVIVFLLNNRVPNIHIPTHSVPRDNGYDYFKRATAMLGKPGPSSVANRKPSQWTVPELEQYVSSNTPALTMLREGLKRKCLAPAMRSANTLYPEFAQCRELARRLVDEGRYYRAIGDYAGAADSHLDCMEFGAVLPRGGSLIAGLVGIAIEAIGTRDFVTLLPKLNARQLKHVAERLERIEARRVPLRDVIQEEGRSMAAMLVEMMGDPSFRRSNSNPVTWLRGGPMSMGMPPSSAGEVWDNVRFAFSNKTAAALSIMDYCNAIAAGASRPYTGKSSASLPGNAVVQSLMPISDRARLAWEKSAAISTVIRAEVASRRYRFDHKRFPDRLSDLVPRYLKAVPTDPLGLRKPLRYRPLSGGRDFLLYSLGCNLRDDGGSPGSFSDSYQTGDIVAGKWR